MYAVMLQQLNQCQVYVCGCVVQSPVTGVRTATLVNTCVWTLGSPLSASALVDTDSTLMNAPAQVGRVSKAIT